VRTLHLFAGAGGGLLADLILGHDPIGAVEWDPYCCAVLRERRDDGWFPGLCVHETDIREFDASEYKGRVDCVSGGFPCVDISVAGKGAGLDGERSGLWTEFARVLREVRPRYAFIENSPALAFRGLDRVLSDLAALGFDAEWCVVSAADVGAAHLRERIWIVAYSDSNGIREHEQREAIGRKHVQDGGNTEPFDDGAAEFVAHTERDGLQRSLVENHGEGAPDLRRRLADAGEAVADADSIRRKCLQEVTGSNEAMASRASGSGPERGRSEQLAGKGRWQSQPALGRVADGMAAELHAPAWWQAEPEGVPRVAQGVESRVDRLKALGNGQVPLQAAMAWRILTAGIPQ
jgi:DNA (cytosine-5)-methyltransferase 1